MADDRKADPDQLEVLADLLCALGGSGAHGHLTGLLERGRRHDVSPELARLKPLLAWLMVAAGQLREGARNLRGEPDSPHGVAPSGLLGGSPGDEEGEWEWEAMHKPDADRIVSLACQDEISDEELDEIRSLLANAAEAPDFAAHLVDEMGMTAFLGLFERADRELAAPNGNPAAESLKLLLTTTLENAFWVPGDRRPGSDAYEGWTRSTVQGRRHAARWSSMAQVGAPWAAELLRQGEDLTDREFHTLNLVLELNADHPEFAEVFAVNLGAVGALQSWTELSDARSGSDPFGPGPAPRISGQDDRMAALQENLGVLLGLARQSQSPENGCLETGDARSR